MPQFSTSTHRFDPYKNFKFRVIWQGKPVAGFSEVSALKPTTEAMEHRGGTEVSKRKSPIPTGYEAITLERGVTHDPEFEAWAIHSREASKPALRKDIVIEMRNEAGRPAVVHKLHRCRVAEYQALPELDADANAVAIEMMKLEHEGWQRLEDTAGRT